MALKLDREIAGVYDEETASSEAWILQEKTANSEVTGPVFGYGFVRASFIVRNLELVRSATLYLKDSERPDSASEQTSYQTRLKGMMRLAPTSNNVVTSSQGSLSFFGTDRPIHEIKIEIVGVDAGKEFGFVTPIILGELEDSPQTEYLHFTVGMLRIEFEKLIQGIFDETEKTVNFEISEADGFYAHYFTEYDAPEIKVLTEKHQISGSDPSNFSVAGPIRKYTISVSKREPTPVTEPLPALLQPPNLNDSFAQALIANSVVATAQIKSLKSLGWVITLLLTLHLLVALFKG